MTVERLIGELRAPSCYPQATNDVQIVQTHLSVVCLAGPLVYKLKKAVTLPFVDFATLAARRRACRDEVRLNRRLCPDTYLGTAALRRGPDGLRFAPTGDDEGPDDVDVAVVMRRLPQERMLDELLRHAGVTTAEIEGLARLVAAFHAGAVRGPQVTTAGDPDRLAEFARANFTELEALRDHGLSAPLLAALARASAADFERILPALHRRAAAGRVVDGHGDLHARNVCMTEPPTIYDCIEFEPAFRCGDVATEVAFLAMDLRHRGAKDLADAFVAAYVTASGDEELPALLPTLCGYRAMVRAKVTSLAAAEPELAPADREGAARSARAHLLLAGAFAAEPRGPWWLVVCGPPASGKSWLCRHLAAAVAWPHIATDVVRKRLAGLAPTATAGPEHYTAEFSQRTYAAVLGDAAAATRGGAGAVLLDGNFPTAEHRSRAATAAAAAGARPLIVFVDVDAATAAARARERAGEPTNVSDADADVTARLRARFAPPDPSEGLDVLDLDGARPVDELSAAVMTKLLR